jgi:glycosyltransferase involved in cell wall biosynthesis
MKKILIFCDFYLPGFKAGGGMWTVVNLVERFSGRYQFFIFTRNYDSKNDRVPYATVKTGEWNKQGEASVFYAGTADITRATCARIVAEVQPDCVFLNSAMSTPVVKFLMARRSGMTPPTSVILAPCGELLAAALAVRPLKKKVYFGYAKLTGLFRGVLWKASTESESREIKAVVGGAIDVMIAPDLVPKMMLPEFSVDQKPAKTKGSARFVFYSRVVPQKNLRYFLERLRSVDGGQVSLEIVGPLQDDAYWQDCKKLISELPQGITVNARGAVSHSEGIDLLCASHFLVLPTLNENFGYVLIESLSAGCPLLISDKTMWSSVQEQNAGWAIPLDDTEQWSATIENCIDMDNDRFLQMSASARAFAEKWLAETKIEEATARVLERALGQEQST